MRFIFIDETVGTIAPIDHIENGQRGPGMIKCPVILQSPDIFHGAGIGMNGAGIELQCSEAKVFLLKDGNVHGCLVREENASIG